MLSQEFIQHWLEDSDLTSVRETASLSARSAEERKAWVSFWSDVAALLERLAPSTLPADVFVRP
jgi:hypothetical protein